MVLRKGELSLKHMAYLIAMNMHMVTIVALGYWGTHWLNDEYPLTQGDWAWITVPTLLVVGISHLAQFIKNISKL